MRLAKDQYGRIGRVVRQNGMTAVIEPASMAGNFGDVYISPRSIAEDEAKARQQEAARRAETAQLRAREIYNQQQTKAAYQNMMGRAQVAQMGALRKDQIMNEKLRRHFMGQAEMCENDRVASTVKADFTIEEEWASGGVLLPINRRADFDIMQTVGNPLTRSGCYGPSTDWDYILEGDELDNARIVGGTMLGRYNGENRRYIPPNMGRSGRLLPYKKRSRLGQSIDDMLTEEDLSNYDVALAAPTDTTTVDTSIAEAYPSPAYAPDTMQASAGTAPAFVPDPTQASAGVYADPMQQSAGTMPAGQTGFTPDSSQASAGTAPPGTDPNAPVPGLSPTTTASAAAQGNATEQSFWDKLWSNTEQQLVGQGSGALSTAIIGSLVPGAGAKAGGGGPALPPGSPPGSSPYLPTPINLIASQLGVNPWVLVGGVGLLGLGIIVSIMRSGKKSEPKELKTAEAH
jgi:hypothetical protein